MRIRTHLAVAAIVGGLLASPHASAAVRTAPAARPPVALAIAQTSAPGKTREQTLADFEAGLGRKLAAYRTFDLWDSPFPSTFDNYLKATGHTSILSVNARRANGAPVSYAAVAGAAPGSAVYDDIARWGRALRDYGIPIYVSFQHEPEIVANADLGTPEEYRAAWRRFHDIVVAQGATNVRWAFIATALGFLRQINTVYYPGDADMSAIAADGYNAYGCRAADSPSPWRSFANVFEGLRVFGLARPQIPLMVTESGSVEDPERPGAKAAWINDIQTTLATDAWSQVRVFTYFNRISPNASQEAATQLETSQSSVNAFQALAISPTFSASAPIATPAPSSVLSGRVSGPNGRAVGSANVLAISPSTGLPVASAATDSTGAYSLTLVAGSYDIRFSVPGWRALAPVTRTGVSLATSTRLDVALPAATLVRFRGKIVNSTATAVDNHQLLGVVGSSGEVASEMTDGSGTFDMWVPAGTYQLRLHGAGFKPFPTQDAAGGSVSLAAGRTQNLVLPVRTLLVKAVTSAGAAVGKASVATGCQSTSYSPFAGLTLAGSQCAGHTWTDPASGVATFTSMPTSASFSVTVVPPPGSGLRAQTVSGVTVTADRTLTVTLPPA